MMVGSNAGLMQQIAAGAKQLGLDPMDVMLKNAIETGHHGMTGEHFASCGLKECLQKVREGSDWDNKYGKLQPTADGKLRGIGVGMGSMAAGARGAFKTRYIGGHGQGWRRRACHRVYRNPRHGAGHAHDDGVDCG